MDSHRLIKSEGASLNERILKEEHQLYYVGRNVDFQSTYKVFNRDLEWKDPTTSVAKFSEIVKCLDITGDESFLDCGCGLGHVLYLASKIFDKVYGVEIVEEAVKQCLKNLSILLPNNKIKVFHNDIFKLDESIIDSIDVFYVSNPFDKRSDFVRLRNLVEESIGRYDRNVHFIYYYPVFEKEMFESDIFSTLQILSSNNGNVNIYRHEK